MRMYPAYTLAGVMQMYAISFFRLLNDGYALAFQDLRLQAQINMAPEMKPEAWENLLENLTAAAEGGSAILEPDVDETSPEKLKDIF